MTATMPDYDARLVRAGEVHLRRARPSDRDGLRALHERLSAESFHLRYFTAAPDLHREFDRLLRPVDDKHETLIALIGGALVGVASYECIDEHTAEIAFLVDDEHHGLGLSTLMLSVLASAARRRGIRQVVADTFTYNLPMMSVFRDCGLPYTATSDDDVMHIRVPLDDEATAGRDGVAHVVSSLHPPLPRVPSHTS
jgi:RimJ/RimL family protein N-acetyltransferase